MRRDPTSPAPSSAPEPPAAAGDPDTRRPARQGPAAQARAFPGWARPATWLGVAAIMAATLVMLGFSAAGPSISVPAVPGGAAPPWWHALRPGPFPTMLSLWAAMALGGAGVITALAGTARGARLRVRPLAWFGVLAAACYTVLPAAGSTDAYSYAVNGRMSVLGLSPYLVTPAHLRALHDPVGLAASHVIPGIWSQTPSVYGPVATVAEWAAAELGGTSLAHIVFWLKLLEAACFVIVALLLDRALRHDPVHRLRAHLLWTANPLVLWEIVAAGHIDGLAATFGLAAILVLRARPGTTGGAPAAGPGATAQASVAQASVAWTSAVASGAFIALAAGVKIEYGLFGLAVAWACRRSVRPLAAAAAGFALVTIPAYLASGSAAIRVLFHRSSGVTWDVMYQLIWRLFGYHGFNVNHSPPYLELVAYLLFVVVAVLAMARMPDRVPGLPALTPALALSLAWLFFTGFQRPWYDVMAISLLALYSASLLDVVVLVRLIAGAGVYVIAVGKPPGSILDLDHMVGNTLTPWIRLLAAAALVWLCVSGRWGWKSGYPQLADVDNEPMKTAVQSLNP